MDLEFKFYGESIGFIADPLADSNINDVMKACYEKAISTYIKVRVSFNGIAIEFDPSVAAKYGPKKFDDPVTYDTVSKTVIREQTRIAKETET